MGKNGLFFYDVQSYGEKLKYANLKARKSKSKCFDFQIYIYTFKLPPLVFKIYIYKVYIPTDVRLLSHSFCKSELSAGF